ncbi:hypothetical protein ACE2AJ_14630 [Aquihabitans daechungensis]|uniref:hypothetical protein n=1 Tax=Aquihabitans daechungensis TaxID=1052257 RepID=UPI003BA1527F
MSNDAKHLNLERWPFFVAATEDNASVWVGRPQFARKLKSLQRSAGRVDSSQIVLLWATFGSGKSHALLHLKALATSDPSLVPVYVVIPQGVKSFLDIYRAIIDAAMEEGVLARLGRGFLGGSDEQLGDMGEALRRIAFGQAGERTAEAWLRGERVPVRELREIGISKRVENVPDAVAALNQLVSALREGGSRTVMLLFDEVQELELLGKKLEESVGGIHKVFDKNQSGLVLVLSFTTGTQSALRGIIGDALFNRAAAPFTLPPLDADGAEELVRGLLEAAAIDPDRVPFPFEDEVLGAVVRELEGRGVELTPRNVIKAFDGILREADLAIEDGEIEMVDKAFALEALDPAG